MTYLNNRKKRGFTLVEIAIVLVIIGLLLGGVLKGQELINNAKVRSIADRQNSLKVAWFAFLDRYAALPGDSPLAPRYIANLEIGARGNGNGLVELDESALVFTHLTQAGYMRCGVCTVHQPAEAASPINSMVNQYGGIMGIFNSDAYYADVGGIRGARLIIHSGPRIPSNILGEVDRKIDDGVANTGDMRMSGSDTTGTGTTITESTTAKVVNCAVSFNDVTAQKATGYGDTEQLEWRAGGGTAQETGGPWPDCQGGVFI